jgi:hypothetical protein
VASGDRHIARAEEETRLNPLAEGFSAESTVAELAEWWLDNIARHPDLPTRLSERRCVSGWLTTLVDGALVVATPLPSALTVAAVEVMASTDAEHVAALGAVLDRALADDTRDSSRAGGGPQVHREGDQLPPAAQAALDRRDPAELDRRWREITGQA